MNSNMVASTKEINHLESLGPLPQLDREWPAYEINLLAYASKHNFKSILLANQFTLAPGLPTPTDPGEFPTNKELRSVWQDERNRFESFLTAQHNAATSAWLCLRYICSAQPRFRVITEQILKLHPDDNELLDRVYKTFKAIKAKYETHDGKIQHKNSPHVDLPKVQFPKTGNARDRFDNFMARIKELKDLSIIYDDPLSDGQIQAHLEASLPEAFKPLLLTVKAVHKGANLATLCEEFASVLSQSDDLSNRPISAEDSKQGHIRSEVTTHTALMAAITEVLPKKEAARINAIIKKQFKKKAVDKDAPSKAHRNAKDSRIQARNNGGGNNRGKPGAKQGGGQGQFSGTKHGLDHRGTGRGNCWDCGLPGHVYGDTRCTRPQPHLHQQHAQRSARYAHAHAILRGDFDAPYSSDPQSVAATAPAYYAGAASSAHSQSHSPYGQPAGHSATGTTNHAANARAFLAAQQQPSQQPYFPGRTIGQPWSGGARATFCITIGAQVFGALSSLLDRSHQVVIDSGASASVCISAKHSATWFPTARQSSFPTVMSSTLLAAVQWLVLQTGYMFRIFASICAQ